MNNASELSSTVALVRIKLVTCIASGKSEIFWVFRRFVSGFLEYICLASSSIMLYCVTRIVKVRVGNVFCINIELFADGRLSAFTRQIRLKLYFEAREG